MNKKLKRSVEKITIPEDVKQRIIESCEADMQSDKPESIQFTDHVYRVEQVRPNNIRRAFSGIAACAVLAGGIGLTAHLMKKQPAPTSLSTSTETEETSVVTSEPLSQEATQQPEKLFNELIEEFLTKEFNIRVPYLQLYESEEAVQENEIYINDEQRAEIIRILRKYDFSEISADEYYPERINNPDVSLFTAIPSESSLFNIYSDGYAYVCLDFFAESDDESSGYVLTRSDSKYFRCSDAVGLVNELKSLDFITQPCAPFGDLSESEFIVSDPYKEINITTEGKVPVYIDMSEVEPEVFIDGGLLPTNYAGRLLTENERSELADFFNHADYELLTDYYYADKADESISFTYLNDQYQIRIIIGSNDLLEYDYIPFTWDKTSTTAIADKNGCIEKDYRIDYQQFRDAIAGILGEDVFYRTDASNETPPFGHLTDYDLNAYQAFGVDWAQGVPAEVVASVEDYINAHHWTEVSQPIEEAISGNKSSDGFVELYNSFFVGGIGYSFAFSNNGYVSMLTSEGVETWYKCDENEDLVAAIDNIIQTYLNNH